MAIRIVQNLNAQQEEVRLPIRVHLLQVLASNRDSEQVQIVYSLNDDHDVWFDGPTKTETRTETIGNAETPIEHRLKLVHAAGDAVERATIRQVITDSQGIRTNDRTSVTVLRGDAQ
jgi:hypothetical protein